MLTAREAAAAIYGAYRLARLDKGGLDFFDATITGFWRSFYAALIIGPFYGLLLILRYGAEEMAASPLRFTLVHAIAYVIQWVAFPLVMFYMCQMLDRRGHYLRYIVAYNWASVLQNGLNLPIALLTVGGGLAGGMGLVLGLAAFAVIEAYAWFITRTALDVPAVTALGIIVLEFLLGAFIQGIGLGML